MENLKDIIQKIDSRFQEAVKKLEEAGNLKAIIVMGLYIGFMVAKKVVEETLAERAKLPTEWSNCHICGAKLRSKGLIKRQIQSLLGMLHWKRRVGRCPNRCEIGQIAPLDEQLEIEPYQQGSFELCEIACLLAVFVPYETAARILNKLFPLQINAMTIWNWVQYFGQIAIANLQQELDLLGKGVLPKVEDAVEAFSQLPLIIGADGVQVPFRPQPVSPRGKIVYKEVKVAILARLNHLINSGRQIVTKLEHRRLVAVLGDIDALQPRLWLEALRQDILQSPEVVWLSDGGRGFWTIFNACFASLAVGILDFYHAIQNLWKAAAAWFDGRTCQARQWFSLTRHRIRQGHVDVVLAELRHARNNPQITENARKVLGNFYEYLHKHQNHMLYSVFKDSFGYPIGSGIVESACKWLIQQRFKGVGMRWSEHGFDNLLHLRLAWTNDRFERVFQ